MTARARKVNRILGVQRQLQRIEEYRLAELRGRLEQLGSDQRELIAALNEDDALQGLFIDSMARRLKSLSDAASKTAAETEAQAARLLEQSGRLACAERLAEAADLDALRAGERRALTEAIEQLAAPPAQASRKIVGG
jgi:CRP-like cAMP-binding protein